MEKKRHSNIPACYLVLMKNNKVLLLRRYNTGYNDGEYMFIAGHVELGETFTQAVIREAKEEAGIDIEADEIMVVHVMHRNSGTIENNERVDVFFIAEKWRGEITNKELHKCDDLSWFDLDNLPDNTIPYIRQAVECIKNKIYYSEYGWW